MAVNKPNKDLFLRSRILSRNLSLGIHESGFIGIGADFEQYRAYQPGDHVRAIDWKKFAATQKLWVKETLGDKQQFFKVIVDVSVSVQYAEKNITRLEYFKEILYVLAQVAYRQADRLEIWLTVDSQLYFLTDSPHINTQLHAINTMDKDLKKGRLSTPIFKSQKQNLIFISDFLTDTPKTLELIKSWKNLGNSICVLHILGQNELLLSQNGLMRFLPIDSKQQSVNMDTKVMATEYNKKLKDFLNAILVFMQSQKINYQLGNMQHSEIDLLKKAFKNR
jgi:uncharacterized protein (DUF58 family)